MSQTSELPKPPTTVLLIEDNHEDADLIEEMLANARDTSFHIEWVECLSAGLTRISQGHVDAILLDLSLPDSDGLDSLRKVSTEAPGLPIIVLTGLAEELNLGVRVLQAGAQDYLVKGQLDGHLLARALRYAIERKQIQKELSEYKDRLEKLVNERTLALKAANEGLRLEFTERMLVEQKLRQITDSMLDVICQTDSVGIIEFASPSCLDVLGISPDELIGQSVYARVHPDDLDTVKEAVQKTGRTEYRYLYADGHYVWLESLTNLLLERDGTVKGIVFASRDVTERKQVEKELQDLSQLKTDFLATAAHELRTPLVSIQGFSEILMSRHLDEERVKRYVTMINEQSTYLARIVDTLLDVSRLESKRGLEFAAQPINLSDLVCRVADTLAESSPKHQVIVEGFQGCPPINGDPFRLTQLLENILSNAVKFSPKGGEILIRAQVTDDSLKIAIRDQGIGMTTEQQSHLFEKFYRADASNTAAGGTGLGLSISRSIVEQHGGKMWVESTHGAGTTVCFTLPLASGENGNRQRGSGQDPRLN